MRLRFSLRWLFLATMVVGVGCYWLMLPTINAHRFVRAVTSADYKRADSCFRDVNDRFLYELNEKHWRFHARIELQPSSLRQLVQGRRLLQLSVAYGDAGPVRAQSFTVVATRAGLLKTEIESFGAGSGGIL